MKNILFLDDEVNILRAIKRVFRNLDYNCYYASNVEEAIVIYLEVPHLDMLVTDIKMPNFDGIRVLKLFREMSPDTIRVALSGYASPNSITEAISKNLAKQYFYKPWQNEVFIINVEKMFALEDKFMKLGLFHTVQNFDKVKTIPKLFDKINQMMMRDASIEDICHVIEEDAAITSNILRIANSAFYSAKTGNLQQAVMYMGLNNLKQMILTYEMASEDGIIFTKAKFIWQHAVLSNRIFHELYERFYNKKVPPVIGSAGLLHDLGQIIMLQIYGETYYEVVLKNILKEEEIIAVEDDKFGLNHTIIGSYFLNWWAFPIGLVEMTLYHHTPLEEGIINRREVALMTLASHMANDELSEISSQVSDALDILDVKETFLEPTKNKYSDEIMRYYNERSQAT